ncbi:beta-glucosidase 13-like [Senna tora]|uniref:Beta-glucosidase 13-like n=1 Tax=Senna tora TaxID=362788 RepID=A0A834WLT5_9FABA|nr:beta-glucosidase 13-like [Senna tora]
MEALEATVVDVASLNRSSFPAGNDFENYAELCFKEFGDRVKHWITLNEPWSYSLGIYTSTKPYLVSHYQLLTHAAVVKLYKAKFMEPLTKGEYPKSMQSLVGSRLPKFSKQQSKLLMNASFDFIGINYYTSNFVAHAPHLRNPSSEPTYFTDRLVNLTKDSGDLELDFVIRRQGPVIEFYAPYIDMQRDFWRNSLIGVIVDDNIVKASRLQNIVNRVWRLQQSVRVVSRSKNVFVF